MHTVLDVLDKRVTYTESLAKSLTLVYNRPLERWKGKNNGTKKKQ